eukprot:11576259-Alexandrium_andersonii.AAC.1
MHTNSDLSYEAVGTQLFAAQGLLAFRVQEHHMAACLLRVSATAAVLAHSPTPLCERAVSVALRWE